MFWYILFFLLSANLAFAKGISSSVTAPKKSNNDYPDLSYQKYLQQNPVDANGTAPEHIKSTANHKNYPQLKIYEPKSEPKSQNKEELSQKSFFKEFDEAQEKNRHNRQILVIFLLIQPVRTYFLKIFL